MTAARLVLLGVAVVAGIAWLGLPFVAGLAVGVFLDVADWLARRRRER